MYESHGYDVLNNNFQRFISNSIKYRLSLHIILNPGRFAITKLLRFSDAERLKLRIFAISNSRSILSLKPGWNKNHSPWIPENQSPKNCIWFYINTLPPPPHILTTKTDNTISEFNILFQIAKVLPNSLAVIFSRTPYPGQHTKNCTMEFES